MECIVSRFKGKLVKMIKDVNGRLDHYTISSKIRQIYCIGVLKGFIISFIERIVAKCKR